MSHAYATADRAYWGGVLAMTLCVFALIASEFMPVSLLTPLAADLGVSEGLAGYGIAIVGLLLGGLAIKALDYGLELASARKNFAKIQRMQPTLVPEPVGELKGVVSNKLSKVRGQRRARQKPA